MSSAIASISRIDIEIGGSGSEPYKSIDNLVWTGVPPFAVLTGLNGSGKTQLLELLAYRLTNTWHPQLGDLRRVNVNITGDSFTPDSVAFVPSRWDIAGSVVLGIAQMQQAKAQLFENLREHQVRHDMGRRAMRSRLERILGVTNLDQLGQQEFVNRLPDDYAFMLDEADVTVGLTHVFLAYRLRTAEALESGTPLADIPMKLGPAPWEVLNETFRVAEFPYRVVSPVGTKLLDPYEILLEDPSTKVRLRAVDLSSGEKVLLGLVVWLYNSQHHGRFPRLFLLDEPDAHLHPSMTRHLLSVIKEVLVDHHNVRTIITTHSPSTVALAPPGAVFEMSKTQPRIVPSRSQAETIGLLTAGLVTVSATTRYVLVEDEQDVVFYSTVRDILTDYGPSRDPQALQPAPSIVFLPASVGTGKAKVGGGKSVVQSWVAKFDQPPLDQLVRGVVDRDTVTSASNRISVIGRYSIENYYLDPFVVYALLQDAGVPLQVQGISLSVGEEHRLRAMDVASLQSIVDAVRSAVEPAVIAAFPGSNTAVRNVSFTNGKTLQYPAWALDSRGHDLLSIYQSLFGGPNVVNPIRLDRSLRRTRLVPQELAAILHDLQK